MLGVTLALTLAVPGHASPVAKSRTVEDTDVAYAGVGGMRSGPGTATLTLSGVSGTVTAAYLYWHGPTNSVNPSANSSVTFGGAPVTGTNIGMAAHNCWAGPPNNFVNSQAYFADVTGQVAGNGAYSLANFVKSGGAINVNGASLVVLYDDGSGANDRDVVIFDGNDSTEASAFDGVGWSATLPGITYSAGTVSLDLHVSDGQSGAGFDDGALVINGTSVVPQGAVFNGDSVPNPVGGAGTNLLWDIDFPNDITSEFSPGPNTLNFTSSRPDPGDCLSLIAAIVNLPAGAAPPPVAPAAVTGSASPGTTTAGLAGTVDPNGEATGYRFQYGKTAAYGSQTPLQSVHAGTSGVPVAANIVGLEPRTTYHYRVTASNAAGPANGSDRTFTTAAAPSAGGVLGFTAQSPTPVARRTVVLREVSGTVLVKRPGSRRFVPLSQLVSVPVGSQVDTRKGRVELTSAADAKGKTQTAQFYDGIFKVTYKSGARELVTRGGRWWARSGPARRRRGRARRQSGASAACGATGRAASARGAGAPRRWCAARSGWCEDSL